MAPLGGTSLARLAGCDARTIEAAGKLADYVTAHGGDIGVPADGGFRTFARQAQLVQYERDSVAAGTGAYAVAPAGKSKHETGRAFDVHVNSPMHGLNADQTYKAMADFAPSLGLRAGYYFGGGPPSPKSDPFHFELADSLATPAGSATLGTVSGLAVVAVLLLLLAFLHFNG